MPNDTSITDVFRVQSVAYDWNKNELTGSVEVNQYSSNRDVIAVNYVLWSGQDISDYEWFAVFGRGGHNVLTCQMEADGMNDALICMVPANAARIAGEGTFQVMYRMQTPGSAVDFTQMVASNPIPFRVKGNGGVPEAFFPPWVGVD